MRRLCYLALDKQLRFTKSWKMLRKTKEAERGVNQLYQNISLAATTIDVCIQQVWKLTRTVIIL